MEIITEKITITGLKEMAEKMFGNLIKAVVDTEQGIKAGKITSLPLLSPPEYNKLKGRR